MMNPITSTFLCSNINNMNEVLYRSLESSKIVFKFQNIAGGYHVCLTQHPCKAFNTQHLSRL